MKQQFKFLFVFFVVVLSSCITGCNTLSGIGSDNAPPPACLVAFHPEFNPQQIWSAQIGYGIKKDYLRLGPVVDDRVFIADKRGVVTAFCAQNGAKLWRTHTRSPITSGPVVGEGMVIVGTNDAQVIALNENNGVILWRAIVPNALLAAPQIGQGKVIARTVDGKLAALCSQNGQLLWLYDHGAPILTLRVNSVPQITDNRVIAGFADGKLAAYNLNQGTLLWEQTIAYPQGITQSQQMVDVVADPVVAGNVIFVATYQGKIAAVSLSTGEILWQRDISTYTGLALSPQLLFVPDAQGTVWAFDRRSGQVVWQQTALSNRVLTAPVIMGDYLVVGDGEGYVHWLAQCDGHFVARAFIGKKKSIAAPPAVLGNFVYVISRDGHLSAWRIC